MLRTGWVVVRRTTRVSSLARSMVIVSAATWTVTMRRAWMRPRAIFCPATMITPVLLATRWAVTGSVEGRVGGPAGRAPRILRACSQGTNTTETVYRKVIVPELRRGAEVMDRLFS